MDNEHMLVGFLSVLSAQRQLKNEVGIDDDEMSVYEVTSSTTVPWDTGIRASQIQ